MSHIGVSSRLPVHQRAPRCSTQWLDVHTHTHHFSGWQRQADWQAHLSLAQLMNWQVCVCVCVTTVSIRKGGLIFSIYIQEVLPMLVSSVHVHVTAWITSCMRTCCLSMDMNSRGVVVLVQRVALTKPKPEQALSVVTDADRQTEDMMRVSISQSNILNWNILLQSFCKACQVS